MYIGPASVFLYLDLSLGLCGAVWFIFSVSFARIKIKSFLQVVEGGA